MDDIKLGDYLESVRTEIMEEWIVSVSQDVQIPTAGHLTMSALRDHFPKLLGELAEQLRRGAVAHEDETVRVTAEEHGKDRWCRGFRLIEILREVDRLREILLRYIRAANSEVASIIVRDQTVEGIRVFFDDVISISTDEFVRAQDNELILRAAQLEQAHEQFSATSARHRSTSESRIALLRAINHELRNALQPVALLAHALREEGHSETRSELRAQLKVTAHRLQSLLDRLGSLSELLAGSAAPTV